ncbi:MAG: hypothetical protein Q9226_008983, partial [Calogaya cf. arnoldii]
PYLIKEYHDLTDINEKFEAAFTLLWNDYVPVNCLERENYKDITDPTKRDEILLTHPDEIPKVCKDIRSLGGSGPGKELEK